MMQHDSTGTIINADFMRGAASALEQQHQKQALPNSPPDTEDELALEFADQHADGLRFVNEWNRWLWWDGTRWCRDRTEMAFDLSRQVCRDAASRADSKDKKRLSQAATVAAVARLARADRRIAAGADEWDSDPDLLNTPDGVVHLPSGDIQPHDQGLKITRITSISPLGNCPMWLAFLDKVTGSNQGLVDYLQRVVGYCLTGHTREHALFFGYGSGANGKSVFINTVRNILKDYAMNAAVETFMATKNEQHPTGLASLRGARLAVASETEAGRQWAESRIKAMTGGDPVQARFMRADFFEFLPTFKLMVIGNHKPVLGNVDEAIRRRLHLIPFTVTIPPEARDEELPDKLKDEWPGILLWAIEGAVQWYQFGLCPPEIVIKATAEYFEEQDAIADWLESACETENLPDYQRENIKDLFKSWMSWAKAAGESPGTSKWFSEQLQNKGFPKKREAETGNRGFADIRLIRPDCSDREIY
jgi:P4 family phage/plasmid primase-like protien